MPEVLEYTYSERPEHLTDDEAVAKYSTAKREHPNALVVLRDLDCGHWQVKVYETTAEKNTFLKRRLDSMVRTFWASIRPYA